MAKRGPKPIFDRPMTGAERIARMRTLRKLAETKPAVAVRRAEQAAKRAYARVYVETLLAEAAR